MALNNKTQSEQPPELRAAHSCEYTFIKRSHAKLITLYRFKDLFQCILLQKCSQKRIFKKISHALMNRSTLSNRSSNVSFILSYWMISFGSGGANKLYFWFLLFSFG